MASDVPILLSGTVVDERDPPSSLTVMWTSDRVVEPLYEGFPNALGGTTVELPALAPGEHRITLGATNSAGRVGAAHTTIIVNRPPGEPEIAITPQAPGTEDALTATVSRPAPDPDRRPEDLSYTFRWHRDGVFQLTGTTVAAALTTRGEVWEVRVRADDGLEVGPEVSASVSIANTPPRCDTARVFPSVANTGQDLACTCTNWRDADGDLPSDRCAFFDGDVALPASSCSLAATHTTRGMEIRCVYTPNDGHDDGEPRESDPVSIVNSPPTAPTAALVPETGNATTTLACNVLEQSTDPDGDSLTYRASWRVNGFENPEIEGGSVVAGSLVSATGSSARRGNGITCAIRAFDGTAYSSPGVSAGLVLGNAPPSIGEVAVEVVGGGVTATTQSALRCVAESVSDPDGDAVTQSYQWFVNHVEVEGVTGQVLVGDHFARGQSVTCAVVADDGHGGVSVSDVSKVPLVIGNALPSLLGASITPPAATPYDVFTCHAEGWYDPDGDPFEVSYAWLRRVGGVSTLIEGAEGATITPTALDAGDELVCRVTPRNGSDLGVPVLSPPALIEPPGPRAPVVVLVAPDGAAGPARCDFVTPALHFPGAVTYTYYWSIGGGSEFIGGATLAGVNPCDALTCRAVATDGTTTLGSNTASLVLPVGPECATGDPCRPATCAPGGGCDFVMVSDVPCDDGNACTVDDRCELGFCVPGDLAPAGAACEDGLFCTAGDACDGAGSCVGGADPCALSASGCLVGACNELEQSCASAPRPAGTSCEDGDGCTVGGSCTAAGVCVPDDVRDCAWAGEGCYAGECVSLGAHHHQCVPVPVPAGAACDTGDFCTVGTTCDGAGQCAGGAPRDCQAEVGDACNLATCDPFEGRCVKTPAPSGTACDDGDPCTLGDTCSNGACVAGTNVCVEELLSAEWPADQRPDIVSMGFGRYLTTWWTVDDPEVALRISDARGGRENEELVSESTGRPATWKPRAAVRPGGDLAVLHYDGDISLSVWTHGCSFQHNLVCVDGSGAVTGVALNVLGSVVTSGDVIPTATTLCTCGTTSTYSLDGLRFHGLVFGSAFSFLVSAEQTRTGNTSQRADPTVLTFPLRTLQFYPATGFMTLGAPVTVLDEEKLWDGLAWDASARIDGTAGFLLLWIGPDGRTLHVRPYATTGLPAPGAGEPWVVHVAPEGQHIHDAQIVARDDGSFVVAWDVDGADGSGRGVYVRRFGASGAPLDAAPARVNVQTTGDQRLGGVDRFADNGFVVAFDDQFGDSDGWGVKARLYAPNGAPVGTAMNVNTRLAGVQHLPAVRVLDDDTWVVAFVDGGGQAWTRRYLQDARPHLGQLEWQLNETTDGVQKHVRAARGDDGAVLAVYESPVFTKPEGEILARLIQPMAQPSPSVGTELQVNTTEVGAQRNPVVAAGGGIYLVAWQSFGQDGAGDGVFARFLSGSATPLTGELQVNTTTAGHQRAPAVAVHADGRALVTWTGPSGASGSTTDIFARGFASSGLPLGDEVRVNDFTAGAQGASAVAIGPDGDAVVVWHSPEQDGSGLGIFARKIGLEGALLGPEVQVNTHVDFDQRSPAVAIAPAGDRLTICWESYGQDEDDSLGVYCQLLSYADLGRIAGEIQVNTLTAGEQRSPSVAYLATGELAVGWDSEGVDSDRFGVQIRKLSALGQTAGPRIVVNRTWEGSQEHPTVVPLQGTSALVVWEGTPAQGGDRDVYFRIISGL